METLMHVLPLNSVLETLILTMNYMSPSDATALRFALSSSRRSRTLHVDYDRESDLMWDWRGREQNIRTIVSSL